MKKYNTPELEIIVSPDVVVTSPEVETEIIPINGTSSGSLYNT